MITLGAEKEKSARYVDGSLTHILNLIGVAEGKWSCFADGDAKGRSGLVHQFDLLLRSREDPAKSITCLISKMGNNDTISRICIFYAHSVDVSAWKKVVIMEEPPSKNEKMLLNSLGIETILAQTNFGANHGDKRLPGSSIGALPQSRQGYWRTKKDSSHRHGSSRYRDRTQIIRDILKDLDSSGEATISKIIFKCNLNYNYATRVVTEMLKKELLTVSTVGDRNKVYRITSTGQDMLEKLLYLEAIR